MANLLAWLWPVLRWLLGTAFLKALIFTTIGLIVAGLMTVVLPLLPDVAGLKTLFQSLPSGLLYLLGVFRVDFGVSVAISASATRFLIRRIPVIG